MEWRFRALTPNDTRVNASHLEFFRDEALSNPVDALVREDIQNRLDAHAPGAPPIEVRYSFGNGHHALGFDKTRDFLFGLRKHLEPEGSREELDSLPSGSEPMGFLVIEDFNSTGLCGCPETTSDPEANGTRNDFYWFIRNVGRSGKRGGDRGRWGLGKIVYPASSRIRSFFAYTVRRDDGRRLLIGRSVLAVHAVDGVEHESEGYFGKFESREYEYFAVPNEEPESLDRFARTFRITRQPDEPGLSIVIPYPAAEIGLKSLVESIVTHYLWELLASRLVVKVSDGAGETVLSASTIEDVIRHWKGTKRFDREEAMAMLRFIRDVRNLADGDASMFQLRDTGKPGWKDIEERFDDGQLVRAKERWSDGHLVGFEVPVRVTRNDGTRDELSSYRLYLQRPDDGKGCSEWFIRDGLTISGVRQLREPGVRALVVVEENALAELLGDSENPAHTHWNERSKHFRNKYHLGPSVLRFVKHAATRVVALMNRRDESLDPDLLKHIFSLPQPEGDRPRPRGRGGNETVPPRPDPPARPRYIACDRQDGGFRIRPAPNATATPASILVRLAYETLRGNPFKQHHPADFDLVARPRTFTYEGTGIEVDMLEPNRMRVRISQPKFHFRMTGFDTHRDLVVDARPEMPGTTDEESDSEEDV